MLKDYAKNKQMELFDAAIASKVAFVPGHPFYIGRPWTDTLRLNFSCVDEATIESGVQRLGDALRRLAGSARGAA